MPRAYNFSAGPSALPEPVLQQAQEELLDWQGCGLSIMEMSHRSAEFMGVARQAEADFRELLGISDNYAVLFMHGGASMQFSAIPLNLTTPGDSADYVCTGAWSEKAIKEAKRLTNVQIASTSKSSNYSDIAPIAEWQINPDAAYLHYTDNETIHGVEFDWIPEVDAPLVVDVSSNILSKPLDVERFGVIYAGAQKNVGPAGLALVVVRKDLLDRARPDIPRLLHWRVIADSGSMDNTPPAFAWYLSGLVFKWIKAEGGLAIMAERNQKKAHKLYASIDQSDFYHSPVAPGCRSAMNVPFVLAESALDQPFLQAAKEEGLLNLKGHRSVGGMRASIYNAVPEAAIDALVSFMRHFESVNG